MNFPNGSLFKGPCILPPVFADYRHFGDSHLLLYACVNMFVGYVSRSGIGIAKAHAIPALCEALGAGHVAVNRPVAVCVIFGRHERASAHVLSTLSIRKAFDP